MGLGGRKETQNGDEELVPIEVAELESRERLHAITSRCHRCSRVDALKMVKRLGGETGGESQGGGRGGGGGVRRKVAEPKKAG